MLDREGVICDHSRQSRVASRHGFVHEFESAEDRDYYMNKNPAHLGFVARTRDMMEDVRMMGYQPGVL